MVGFKLRSPVLMIIFNRPDTTIKVFETIRKAQPSRLYISADGPRVNRSDDTEKCMKVRDIVNKVDWDCQVYTLFRDENLGCKKAVSSGISWFFEHEEEGIVLEDDCLPDSSFFSYCDVLLEKYRYDNRIMIISGDNFQFGHRRTDYSYYFSKYAHIWGWASWRRAWNFYDLEMKLWPEIKENGWLFDILEDKRSVNYWTEIFDTVYNNKLDTWDYQWLFTLWIHNGLCILPNVNLISNIGFGIQATHTKMENILSKIQSFSMDKPIIHPEFMIWDRVSDNNEKKISFPDKKDMILSALSKRIRKLIK